MKIPILDHGYLELVETWGSDQAIIEAARMSTGKGFLGWDHYRQCRRCKEVNHCDVAGTPSHPGGCSAELDRAGIAVGTHDWRDVPEGDAGLLRYLWTKDHATPFEFAGMVIEVKAPIMVFREWHRHRSQGYNEASARYEPLPDENYLPTVERCMLGGGHLTKQAGTADGATSLTKPDALVWLTALAHVYDHAERVYQSALRRGIPKELARLPVPVGRYSKMRATTNLRMWLAFSKLRSTSKNPAAQWEIRQYADAAGALLSEHFPRTWKLFSEAGQARVPVTPKVETLARQLVGSHQAVGGNVTVDKDTFLALADALRADGPGT